MNDDRTFLTRWRLPLFFFLLASFMGSANADTAVNKTWSEPMVLANTTLDYSGDIVSIQDGIYGSDARTGQQKIITNKNGKAFAVWTQRHSISPYSSNPRRGYVEYTHWSAYFNGARWTSPMRIKGINPSKNIIVPEIVFDGSGHVLAAWSEPNDETRNTPNTVFTSRFDTIHRVWDNPIQLAYDNGQSVRGLRLILRNKGVIHAMWRNRPYLWSSVFDGSSWSNPIEDETSSSAPMGSISLRDSTFSNYSNDIIFTYPNVTYDILPDTIIGMFAEHFNGTNWSTTQRLSTDISWSAARSKTAFDNNGNAITVWTEMYERTAAKIFASHFNRNSRSWSAPVSISESGTNYNDGAKIAINDNGHAIVVWTNGNRLWSNYFNGSNWGTASPIESTPNDFHYSSAFQARNDFKIAFDGNNHAHVVWSKTVGGNNNVWANSFDGTRWSTAAPIESTEKEVQIIGSLKSQRESGAEYLELAIDDDGNAHALWKRSISTRERESTSTPFTFTKTQTIWTSQLKAVPPLYISRASIFTRYGGLVLITGWYLTGGNSLNFHGGDLNGGIEYNYFLDQYETSGLKLVDENGNPPLTVYAWQDSLVVALFNENPKFVTITTSGDMKTVPLMKY